MPGTAIRSGLAAAIVLAAACERTAPPAADEQAAQADAPTEVRAVLTEWGIELGLTSIPAGPVVFHVRNAGQYEHVFEVERGDEEWETGRMPPGAETMLAAELAPGTYEIYCPVEDAHGDHRELGMVASLTVQ